MKRDNVLGYLRVLAGFALVDYAVGILIGLFYVPPKGPVDFLYDVLFQLIAGSVGVIPLAAASSGLWLLLVERIDSTIRLGAAIGLGSMTFILLWVNFVLGDFPAQQPSQVLSVSLGIASGAYAAWMSSWAQRIRHERALNAAVSAPACSSRGEPPTR